MPNDLIVFQVLVDLIKKRVIYMFKSLAVFVEVSDLLEQLLFLVFLFSVLTQQCPDIDLHL